MVPSGRGEVVTIVRDFTEQRRAEAEHGRLADEQAALRRVATLVAGDAAPEQVFQAVTEEVCRLLGLLSALLQRFEDATDGDDRRQVRRARTSDVRARQHAHSSSEGAALAPCCARVRPPGSTTTSSTARSRRGCARSGSGRASACRSASPASTWGALVAALREGETLPVETERRLQAFAELVALAVASAQARDELAASRLRIVEAERRRAPPHRAQPPRRRPAAARRALGRAAARPGEDAGGARRGRASCSRSPPRSWPRR